MRLKINEEIEYELRPKVIIKDFLEESGEMSTCNVFDKCPSTKSLKPTIGCQLCELFFGNKMFTNEKDIDKWIKSIKGEPMKK